MTTKLLQYPTVTKIRPFTYHTRHLYPMETNGNDVYT